VDSILSMAVPRENNFLQYNNPYYGVLVTVPINEESAASTQVRDNCMPGEKVDAIVQMSKTNMME